LFPVVFLIVSCFVLCSCCFYHIQFFLSLCLSSFYLYSCFPLFSILLICQSLLSLSVSFFLSLALSLFFSGLSSYLHSVSGTSTGSQSTTSASTSTPQLSSSSTVTTATATPAPPIP